jgi:hypothetical protein
MTFLPLMKLGSREKTFLPLSSSFLLSLLFHNQKHEIGGKIVLGLGFRHKLGKIVEKITIGTRLPPKIGVGICIGTQSSKSYSFAKRYREEENPGTFVLYKYVVRIKMLRLFVFSVK